MDGVFVTITVIAVLACFLFLFFIGDQISKRSGKAAVKPAVRDAPKKEEAALKPTEPARDAAVVRDSNLADDIVAMLPKTDEKREENKPASERSHLLNRRDRMISFYNKKYKDKSAAFSRSFDEQIDEPQLVVDGVEITRDDIKKLTALHGLFERKSAEE